MHVLARSALLFAALLAAPASAVTIDWVAIGDPGNAADPDTDFGSVAEIYRISKFEITNAQYVEFLNAVAASDPNGLYSPSGELSAFGGIQRHGTTGSHTYSVKPGDADKPVNFVNFWDATRFANWLHNGQPSGPQGNATTEDGAYTLTQSGIDNNTVQRNAGALFFIPNENEWYKAAYYDPAISGYYEYPAGFEAATTCALPGSTPNTANCENVVDDLTDVGSYTASASPFGTFDQGGNVTEWIEDRAGNPLTQRRTRGGNFDNTGPDSEPSRALSASWRDFNNPENDVFTTGFRLAASVPEPSTALLLGAALIVLALQRRSA